MLQSAGGRTRVSSSEVQGGDVVADRFELLHVAGEGGMGTVWRARDRADGRAVAVKVLRRDATDSHRFTREARLLAGLSHPAIVRLLESGETLGGDAWYAMEWLDGVDLSRRIATAGRLPAGEVLRIGRRVAEALGAAHARGIVHRDVKPSNVFLPASDPDRAKLLDFGVARAAQTTVFATAAGVLVGTPAYMAPEQARASGAVDARADVFSLGCVLYEALSGAPPFAGGNLMAVLCKILLEPAPRLAERFDGFPPALDAFLQGMLAKDPADRPPNGAVVAAALESIDRELPDERRGGPLGRVTRTVTALGGGEQRLLGVAIAGRPPGPPANDVDETLVAGDAAQLVRARALADVPDAKIEALADGSVVAIVTGSGLDRTSSGTDASAGQPVAPPPASATDQAARAARLALAMRAALADSPVAVATGRVVVGGPSPVGEAIDRAVALVTRAAPGREIAIDPTTAGLLDTRFEIGGTVRGDLLLVREREVDTVRTLLGRETPFVGRDRELTTLAALLDECVGESMARAALVTGEAGLGKSRLRYELVRSAREGRGAASIQIWVGRGDVMRAGSPFAVIAGAVRRTAGLIEGEPIPTAREKLRARIARHHPTGADRCARFVGETIGVRFPEEDDLQLQAARRDPILMSDRVRRAYEEWIRAETGAQPLLFVLEDLHWGDAPSLQLVDALLRALRDQPLMVLGLGRPELHTIHPGLFAERDVTELRLGELGRRGAEKLVRSVLGEAATPERAAEIIERAGGNVFYLEELIRAVAEGHTSLPETVLAMVQARLDALEPEARRVLRAAGVFGEWFWTAGVAHLLGDQEATGTRDWLRVLAERELVSPVPVSRLGGQEEHVFRHALVREGAYTMLTDEDRALGHRLAAGWLEAAGERDALSLAEHWERAGDGTESVARFRRAAEQALEAQDLRAAVVRAERGVVAGATGEELGKLRAIEAEAYAWRGENEAAVTCAREAMEHLPPGSPTWCVAVGAAATGAGRTTDAPSLDELGHLLLALPDPLSNDAALAIARTTVWQRHVGLGQRADELLARVAGREGDTALPAVAAAVAHARAVQALFAGDVGMHLLLLETAADCFRAAGDLRHAWDTEVSIGYALVEVGAYPRAEQCLRRAIEAAEKLGLSNVASRGLHNLGLALAGRGALDEARAVEARAIDASIVQGDLRMEASSRTYLAKILRRVGDLAAAEREARLAVDLLGATPPLRAGALAVLADVLLAAGPERRAEALELATRARADLDAIGRLEEGESLVRLVHAEALAANGRQDEARRAFTEAGDRLVERAHRIADGEWRRSFLHVVPENARTLERAAAGGAR